MTSRSQLSSWIWALGAAGLVLAARLHEIHLYTGNVAINDQWKIEAADLLAPWLQGTLFPSAFFLPHFEHVPVWTRLNAWLTVALTGRWDPLVQTTVNALLYCSFVLIVVRWVTAHLRPLAAMAITLLLVTCSVLPHDWENITWGFQSQFPFALLFLVLHLQGSFAYPKASRGWWLAQAAGLAGLFTLAGMWIAPLAVVVTGWWVHPRKPKMELVPLGLVALGLGIIGYIRATAPAHGAFAQTAGSVLLFLRAWFDLLGWPAGWPGALILLNLPCAYLILQLRQRERATAFDRTVMALGLWTTGQAAALAFARSADYSGYVSRYGELLAILVLANALALARLLPSIKRWRPVTAAFGVAWTAVVLAGWWQLSTGGHTRYFHEHAAENAQIRQIAVQAYLQQGDRNLLEQQTTRWVLYQDVNQITTLLDDPAFRALLPHAVNPSNPPDFAGKIVRLAQRHTLPLGGGSVLLLLVGATGFILGNREMKYPLETLSLSPQAVSPLLPACLALAAFLLLFCWPAPFTFNASSRWRLILTPEGNVGPLQVEIITGSADYPGTRLVGAAPLSPPALRDLFTGTSPGGPELTCTAWSKLFPINAPWFVVPYAGWPVAHGNGLRLRIEETDGTFITEVECLGPNDPEIAFWTAEVRSYFGKQARLVLYDGRTETKAWVAAAPPIPTHDAQLGLVMTKRMQIEASASLHTSLGIVAIVALCFTGLVRRLRL
ncbi:MAG: hypothetical protein K9M98_03765 [Cephaloticoccus sp.]|nr:hypothetical protein [Cephaloticoccus sp.]MCF7759599.1 hypothetical protein [Cephaloticoccus sp.]